MIEEHAPLREQVHSPGGTSEELRSDFVLERPDLPTQRRLSHVKPLRRAPDIVFLGDGDEVANLREAHARNATSRLVPSQVAWDPRSKRYWTFAARLCHNRRMPVEILGPRQIEAMRHAGRIAAETLAFVGSQLHVGMSTGDIDRLVREDTARRGGKPSQLGYKGFPAAVCTSRNNVVCHGIPRANDTIESGDIINVDVTTNVNGFHGDTSATFIIGQASDEARRLVDIARRCRDAGIAVIREGARLGDIGAAIQELAKFEGVSVVREFGGHGIGRHMHAEPHVSHTGRRGTGRRLQSGMALTVEPMINLGAAAIRLLDDGWTVVTADGSLSAQWEHTVVVTRDGCEVVTLPFA